MRPGFAPAIYDGRSLAQKSTDKDMNAIMLDQEGGCIRMKVLAHFAVKGLEEEL